MTTHNDSERRVALVTGGAMGIGGEVCKRLAAAGHQVLVADLNMDAAHATAQALRDAGGQATALALDVGQPESITQAFAQVECEHGRCDMLVNCAGIAKVFPFIDFPLDNFVATMNVNVTGTLLCAQAAARLMLPRRWGRIVNIASVAGMRAVGSGRTAYGTSKGAVIALTRQMAVELAEHGITANAVAPGPVDTPMTQVLHSDQFRQEYAKAIPMNRYGTTGEIASAVLYLLSEDASYISGAVLPVDGGFLASGARGVVSMALQLQGQVAIVTGAASPRGIGFATAKRFADEGALVVILDLNAQGAEQAAASIGSEPRNRHIGLACDVRDEAACNAAVQHVLATLGHIDVLVNNAGVSQSQRLLDSTQADYDLVMDSSVRGAFNMSRAVVPHMRERRSGAIVCMGSVAAQRGGGILGGPHYSAAKGAIQTLAKAMARELAPDGIRVNAVAPGMVDTDLLVGKIDDAGKQRVADSVPLGRLAAPADIANACLFLASAQSAYVTGVVLDVSGGLHIH